MTTLREVLGGLLRTLVVAACVIVTTPVAALAQSPAPEASGPDVFGNMPGATILLVPIVIGGALYISRRLGPRADAATSRRREGAVSRTLARTKRT